MKETQSTFANKVVYQAYPKSFKDTNGDGIGDLRGIIEKLPYLAKLGIDYLWLNPIFPSPQRDNGYDISDYCAIDPVFGTMADFEELVAKAAADHISIMMDMVFNHTSTAHIWFQKALAGDKKYQNYYILRPKKADGSAPTSWESKFGGSAWAPFGHTDLDYLHLYDVSQADLNWRNSEVIAELNKVLNFWLDKGAKAFRFDVINVVGKDQELLDDPHGGNGKAMYTDRPIVHDYLQNMYRDVFAKHPEVITVGELSSTTVDNAIAYTAAGRHELSMAFSFHHLKVDYENGNKWTKMPYDFEKLRHILHEWGKGLSDGGGWPAWFWNNHDQPRAINRFIKNPQYYHLGAAMLAAAIHLNRGTPYIYMGEEIGMTDPDFKSMSDYVDVESQNAYQELLAKGMSADDAFAIVKSKSRDNSRIPMQWNADEYAGFSDHKPWLANGDFQQVNAAKDLADPQGLFQFYQRLIALRKQETVIALGDYQPMFANVPEVYAFKRQLQDQHLLVVTHFGEKAVTVDLPKEAQAGSLLLANYADSRMADKFVLRPYEVIAIKY
ncbi:MAG: alpha,alpha-phosphotrehalase [Oenococcus sp.]|uniref:alpha,alpha-phosphotrehalase n=1 Tax=Oenococcus TaxID=46254 RepID=UPI0021E884C8|nr:alpha,alpha-phosphotrehalase [Oenococcus kitaharae]MCV3296458.1 alpha,alpha-phosphotrehalase [Oenococcus kitaharae]